jgi:hypothetical protein
VARGKPADVGETRVSKNGYHYTRTEDGWRLTHHLVAIAKLRRELRPGERVYFGDGDKTNLTPYNIRVTDSTRATIERRIRHIDDQVEGLRAQKEALEDQLAKL